MFNSYWLENGNFLRLDNIVLHYEFKPRPQIKGMKAFVGANNVFLWTRYSGIDPEMDLSNITGGVQYLQFFYKNRGFNAGFQIEF
jgi:iron complex outermembrane receptor protein